MAASELHLKLISELQKIEPRLAAELIGVKSGLTSGVLTLDLISSPARITAKDIPTLEKAAADAGIKVALLTATPIGGAPAPPQAN